MHIDKTWKETIFIGTAFLLALILRFISLDSLPLSDAEANWALQALALSKGTSIPLGPQPLYVVVTSALFSFFGDDNLIVRLLPALSGSLLVFAPFMFRRVIGEKASLWLAFALAIDPGLVTLSRLAGSSMPAIAFTLLALGCLAQSSSLMAGIFTALALFSGPSLWTGWIAIALTWVVFRYGLKPGQADVVDLPRVSIQLDRFFLAFAATILVAGTLFFTVPEGIGGLGSSLSAYLAGWRNAGGVTPGYLLAGVAAGSLLAIPLAIWTGVRSWVVKDRLDRSVSIWLLISLALVLIYPARQMQEAGWVIIPLWVQAARGLSRLPAVTAETRLPATIFTLVAVAILFFVWLSFTGYLQAWQTNSDEQQVRGLALTGGLVLLALATILVGWGWSALAAGVGITRAVLILLFLYLLSWTTVPLSQRRLPVANQWQDSSAPQDQVYLLETIGDLSLWNTGRRDAIEMVVVDLPISSMEWTLRDMPNVRFSNALQPGSQPPLVLTAESQQPELAASYRGQAFVWDISPDWPGMSLIDQASWVAFHTTPTRRQTLILWARADQFIDHTSPTTSSSSTSP